MATTQIDGGGGPGWTAWKPKAQTTKPTVAPTVGVRPGAVDGGGDGWASWEQDSLIKGAEDARAAWEAQWFDQFPPAPPGGSNGSSGYRGRGYGSGGGVSAAKLDALLARITEATDKDRASARQAMGNFDQYAAGLGNAYRGVAPARQAQVDPTALLNLIRSQGGGDAGLLAQAQFLQAENGATAGASDRMVQMLAAGQDAWNTGTRSAGKLAGEQIDADLAAQLLALRTQIEAQKAGM